MDKFNKEEHWTGFIEGKYAVNCKTEELADEFLKYCHKQGKKWFVESLLDRNSWDLYNEKTCYCSRNPHMEYSPVEYWENQGITVVEFQGFDTYVHVKQPKPPLGVMPKDIYELQRVQELCRALYERSTFETVDYELMHKWSEELNDRLFNLQIWE